MRHCPNLGDLEDLGRKNDAIMVDLQPKLGDQHGRYGENLVQTIATEGHVPSSGADNLPGGGPAGQTVDFVMENGDNDMDMGDDGLPAGYGGGDDGNGGGDPDDEGDPQWDGYDPDDYYTKLEVDTLLSQSRILTTDTVFNNIIGVLEPVMHQLGQKMQQLEIEIMTLKQTMSRSSQHQPAASTPVEHWPTTYTNVLHQPVEPASVTRPEVMYQRFEQNQPTNFEIDGIKVELTPNRGVPLSTGGSQPAGNAQFLMDMNTSAVPTVRIGAFGRSSATRGQAEAPRQLMGLGGGYPPSLYALQHHVEAPYLDPRKKETWAQFERLWPEWSKYQLYGIPEGAAGDMMRRDLLLTRLHPVLRDELRERVASQPTMSSQEVYEYLQKYFAVDDPHFWRKKWANIKLRTSGDRVELAEWQMYRSKFETALKKVQEWTEAEVVEAILSNLPNYWVQEVVKEEAKKQGSAV